MAQSSADRATARQLGEDGEHALDAKDYKRAEDDFRRADSLVHAPTLSLGLARALAAEGKLVDAQEIYKTIIREGVAPGAPDVFKRAVESAKTEVQDITPKLGGITVTVTAPGGGSVPNVKVTLDDTPLTAAVLGVKRVTDPGPHVVRASADGFKPASINVTVPVGGSVDAPLTLAKDDSGAGTAVVTPPPTAPATTATPASSSPAPDAPPPSSRGGAGPWPWVAFGIGGAGLVTGIVTGVMAISKRSDTLSHCSSSGVCPPDQQSNVDSYNTLGLVSTVGFVVAGVGAAAGVTILFLQPKGGDAPAATGFHVVPVVGLGSLGAKGSF
jgi:hypothetical protein